MWKPGKIFGFLIVVYSCGMIQGMVDDVSASPADSLEQRSSDGSYNRFAHEKGKYFEGDIVLPQGFRAVSMMPRWRKGIIPYTIHRSFRPSERKAIYEAMQDIEAKTCIEFKKRSDESNYVRITNLNQGCFSFVGRAGGSQQLNLGPGCVYKTTIIHELTHAIGMWHEQSRQDRDRFINIMWNNIPRNYWSEFQKHNDLINYGTLYDYRSVMHYSYNAFARDRSRPTIITKRKMPLRLLGMGDNNGGLTEIDALQINRMYKCENYRDPYKMAN
ncbi:unnamed protein product [Orchesella dallaii]|uniref:Metalloendopeptidase n=1 Tax=Orchesella dallaii TaxID=48710 RepID=A0ABP1QRV8_9HEXA